jgi:hypothetical protein
MRVLLNRVLKKSEHIRHCEERSDVAIHSQCVKCGLPRRFSPRNDETRLFQKIVKAASSVFLMLALTACNQTAPAPVAPKERTSFSYVTPPGFKLPEGQGCSGDIARFQAVQANDLETGHVNKSVHDRIAAEVNQASALCSAGNDGGARASLAAIKKRYGYPG